VEPAGDQFVAGTEDGGRPLGIERAELGVGAGGGLLDVTEGPDQVGHGRNGSCPKSESFLARGPCARPNKRRRDLLLAQEIMLDPEVG
jgi:hypothetical protein